MTDDLLSNQPNKNTQSISTLVQLTDVEKQNDDEDCLFILDGTTVDTPNNPSEEIEIKIIQYPPYIEDDLEWKEGNWYFFAGLRKIPQTKEYIADVMFYCRDCGERLRDDWMYITDQDIRKKVTGSESVYGASGSLSNGTHRFNASSNQSVGSTLNNVVNQSSQQNLGLSVGGEKDGNNFRDNILNGFVPEIEAVSSEGIFHDYYFERNDQGGNSLFYPSFSTAYSPNPISKENEPFITVGLNSNIEKDEFERPDLNLVIVIDISGSMNSQFDEYYYNQKVRHNFSPENEEGVTKIQSAIESIKELTTHLSEGDSLGIVLFNQDSHLAKPLRHVEDTDLDAIRTHVSELEPSGQTNMSAGFEKAQEMLEPVSSNPDTESRVMFLTDEMPNTGQTTISELTDTFTRAANNNIYTSFIGVGLDANPKIGEEIGKIKGANHYFIHSHEEFKKRLDDEFDYMVTPLVHDLTLNIESSGYEIENVYGTPSYDPSSGDVISVPTLFPSPTNNDQTKGGVILVQLRSTDEENNEVTLKTSWEETDEEVYGSITNKVSLAPEVHYQNTGVRKAIVLSRYCDVLRSWVKNKRKNTTEITQNQLINEFHESDRFEHDEVRINAEYNNTLIKIKKYISDNIEVLDDSTLQKEVEVIDSINEIVT